MKKTLKKLHLRRETLTNLDLVTAAGSETDGCWVSRAFTNCTYCNSKSLWQDCIEATKN